MRLLLAVDVHEHPEAVVDEAGRWVRRVNGTLDLVYVNAFGAWLPYLHGQALTVELQAEVERLRVDETKRLDALLMRLPADDRGEAHLLAGDPVTAVVEKAPGYDAILVATHGRTGLAHLWMGSVAEQIVRRAPVPVIVLRIAPEPSR